MATELIRARYPQLQDNVPELFESPGTLLYIGANTRRHHYCPELFAAGNELTVLEVWEPNIAGLKSKEMFRKVILGDVRSLESLALGRRMFDYVMHWHGPEHLPVNEYAEAIRAMERIAKRCVILASPWGVYQQGAYGGNEFETHQVSLYPTDFQDLGYMTRTLGVPDVIDSNILAWKRLPFVNRRRKVAK